MQGRILLVGGLGPSLLRWDWETATTIHIMTHCLGLSDVPQPLIYPIVSAK